MVIFHVGRRKGDTDDLNQILDQGRFVDRHIGLIVVSQQPNPELELLLARQGAAEFLERPLELNRVTYLVETMTIRARENAAVNAESSTDGIVSVGDGQPFVFSTASETGRMMETVRSVAPQDTNILLTGERARQESPRSFDSSDVAATRSIDHGRQLRGIIRQPRRKRLFGHVSAFTGADRDRTGKCAEVGQGTLLLDDVDSLSLETQAKLLRLVEDRVFERVGSNKVLPMEAPIVTTNRNLREAVAGGRFRADLFYRLNVVEFALVPLRVRLQGRPEVLTHLAETFLNASSEKLGRKFKGFTSEALQVMQAYSWPGNIREVRNAVERAVALANGPFITVEDLPSDIRLDPAHDFHPHHAESIKAAENTLARTKDEAEIARIHSALTKHAGNRQRAATELGISRMTLYNKLRRYGI